MKDLITWDSNDDQSAEFDSGPQIGPLPKGEYRAVISDARVQIAKSSNLEYVTLTYTVLDPVEYRDRLIFHDFYVNGKQAQREITNLKAVSKMCGVRPRNEAEMKSMLGGKVVGVKVSVYKDEYMGEERMKNRVVDVFPADGAAAQKYENAAETDSGGNWTPA